MSVFSKIKQAWAWTADGAQGDRQLSLVSNNRLAVQTALDALYQTEFSKMLRPECAMADRQASITEGDFVMHQGRKFPERFSAAVKFENARPSDIKKAAKFIDRYLSRELKDIQPHCLLNKVRHAAPSFSSVDIYVHLDRGKRIVGAPARLIQ